MEKIEYNAMLSNIQKRIKESKEELEKLEKIDGKYCKRKVEMNKLIEIIENYKSINLENKNENLTIICNGNPYVVLNIAMIAILKNINIEINIDNIMTGINHLIIKIINNVLKENKLEIKIHLTEEETGEKLIFIDRINEFNIIKKGKYIPYESIDIYSDSEEYEDLYEKIYNYAISLNIDIDIFDDENIETMIKYGKSDRKIILTKNKEIIDKYSETSIYVNENPFKEEKVIFENNIIEKIIN